MTMTTKVNSYDQGTPVRCRGTFTDPDTGLPLTPSDVRATFYNTTTTTTTIYRLGTDPQLTLVSAGVYQAMFDTSAEAGLYQWRMRCPSGFGQVSAQGEFFVVADPLP